MSDLPTLDCPFHPRSHASWPSEMSPGISVYLYGHQSRVRKSACWRLAFSPTHEKNSSSSSLVEPQSLCSYEYIQGWTRILSGGSPQRNSRSAYFRLRHVHDMSFELAERDAIRSLVVTLSSRSTSTHRPLLVVIRRRWRLLLMMLLRWDQ